MLLVHVVMSQKLLDDEVNLDEVLEIDVIII
jgi:hypothetical protein